MNRPGSLTVSLGLGEGEEALFVGALASDSRLDLFKLPQHERVVELVVCVVVRQNLERLLTLAASNQET